MWEKNELDHFIDIEAEEQVDLYMADHPELQRRSQHRELNLIPLVLAAAVAVVAYVAFEML